MMNVAFYPSVKWNGIYFLSTREAGLDARTVHATLFHLFYLGEEWAVAVALFLFRYFITNFYYCWDLMKILNDL